MERREASEPRQAARRWRTGTVKGDVPLGDSRNAEQQCVKHRRPCCWQGSLQHSPRRLKTEDGKTAAQRNRHQEKTALLSHDGLSGKARCFLNTAYMQTTHSLPDSSREHWSPPHGLSVTCSLSQWVHIHAVAPQLVFQVRSLTQT